MRISWGRISMRISQGRIQIQFPKRRIRIRIPESWIHMRISQMSETYAPDWLSVPGSLLVLVELNNRFVLEFLVHLDDLGLQRRPVLTLEQSTVYPRRLDPIFIVPHYNIGQVFLDRQYIVKLVKIKRYDLGL